MESQQDADEVPDVPLYFLGAGESSAAVAELTKVADKGRPRLRHLDHAAGATGALRMYFYPTHAQPRRGKQATTFVIYADAETTNVERRCARLVRDRVLLHPVEMRRAPRSPGTGVS